MLGSGAIVGAGDASADKPSPAPIWHALERIGVKPSPAVWYVGDTGSDMLAAHRAGCLAVLVGDAAMHPAELLSPHGTIYWYAEGNDGTPSLERMRAIAHHFRKSA